MRSFSKLRLVLGTRWKIITSLTSGSTRRGFSGIDRNMIRVKLPYSHFVGQLLRPWIIFTEHILHRLCCRSCTFHEVINQLHEVGMLAWRFQKICRAHGLTAHQMSVKKCKYDKKGGTYPRAWDSIAHSTVSSVKSQHVSPTSINCAISSSVRLKWKRRGEALS
jgi:hypothetical protein